MMSNKQVKKQIILIGGLSDPHVLHIKSKLIAKKQDVKIFDRYSTSHKLAIDFDHPEKNKFIVDEVEIFFENVKSIWWRLKKYYPWEFRDVAPNSELAFSKREWRHTLNTLHLVNSRIKWVNPVEEQGKISYKPYQLVLAKSVGLKIPRTIITNDVKNANNFVASNKESIYKVLSWYFNVPDAPEISGLTNDEIFKLYSHTSCETIYTTKIKSTDINRYQSSVKNAPCQFQELIIKKYEYRINVVGSDIFTAKINSQHKEHTRLDWRKDQLADMYSISGLPKNIEDKIVEFHKRSGLVIAAYDFIEDINGEFYFLECNPGGQWLWIEDKLKMPISDSLVEYLCIS